MPLYVFRLRSRSEKICALNHALRTCKPIQNVVKDQLRQSRCSGHKNLSVSIPLVFNLEVVMSSTRWFVSATFTGGLIALSLQVGGIAQSAPSSILLIADSSSTSQNEQQKVPSGAGDAESSSKMHLEKDGSGIMDPQLNKIGGQIGTSAQRSDNDTPKTPGSRLTERSGITGSGSDKSGATGGSSSSGMSGGSGPGCCGK